MAKIYFLMLILIVLRNGTPLRDRLSQLVEAQIPIFQRSIVCLEHQQQSRLVCVWMLVYFDLFFIYFIIFYSFFLIVVYIRCYFV